MSEEISVSNLKVGEVGAREHATSLIFQTLLPENALLSVDSYTDEVFANPDSESHAEHLAGQIRKGRQLRLDPAHPKMGGVMSLIGDVALMYINQYWNRIGQEPPGHPNIRLHDIWSVHSFSGDYNPIHYHDTPHSAGLSFTFYTEVPPQVLQQAASGIARGPYGSADGYLYFVHGEVQPNPEAQLKFTAVEMCAPKRGLLMMWPKWLPHYVTPFEGAGERRSIAGNLDIWYGATKGSVSVQHKVKSGGVVNVWEE